MAANNSLHPGRKMELDAANIAAQYILETLSKQKHNPHFYAHVIFMYAGEGTIEALALQMAKEMHAKRNPGSKPLKFGNVYLIDVDIERIPKTRIDKFKPHAKNPVYCTFSDMVKTLYSSKIRDFRYAVCVGVHPQHYPITVKSNNPEQNQRAILNALNMPIQYNYPGMKNSNAIHITFGRYGLDEMKETVGTFHRLWIYHFEKGFAYVWRDRNICRISIDDLDFKGDPMHLDGKQFHTKVQEVAMSKCRKEDLNIL